MLISISELIKRSFNLYKENFFIIFKYLLLSLIPSVITMVLMGLAMLPILGLSTTVKPIMFILIPVLLLIFLAVVLLSAWFGFALIKVVDLLNKKLPVPAIKEVLKDTKTVIWQGFGVTVLVGLYTSWPLLAGLGGWAILSFVLMTMGIGAVSTILKIFFGLLALYGLFHLVYFSVKLMFSVYAVVIDHKKIKESMTLSGAIVKGKWWGIAGRLIVTTLVVYIILMIVYSVLAIAGGLLGSIGNKVMGYTASIINFVISPYLVAVTVILFDEVKKNTILTPPQS